MTSLDSGLEPAAMPGMFKRNLIALGGLVLFLSTLVAAASLATWSVNDPSLTYAADGVTNNALGFWGASFADLVMQFLGLAGILAIVPAAIWGWLLFTSRHIGQLRKRSAAWIFGVILVAAAFGSISTPVTWPLPVGLGGVIGDVVLKLPALLTGNYPNGLISFVLLILFALPGLWLLMVAAALLDRKPAEILKNPKRVTSEDYDEPDTLFGRIVAPLMAPIGLVMHWGLSARTMFGRIFRFGGLVSDRPSRIKTAWRKLVAPPDDGLESFDGNQRIDPDFGENRNETDEYYHDTEAGIDDDWREMRAPDGTGQVSAVGSGRVVTSKANPKPGKRIMREAQSSLLLQDEFELPPIHLLSEAKRVVRDRTLSDDALEQNARLLEGVLEDFGVKGEIIKVHPGPVVTLYELEPAPGIKSSRVIGLADDIARSMSAIAARVAVIPGRNAIGIELPNSTRETVFLRELLASEDFEKSKAKLALCLGKTIGGDAVIADLAKMPHLLVAGTTGSGKSVAINTMILSVLYKLGPEHCKLIMIDPKMLELSVYDGIPHLLTPVVTDPKKAVVALKWTVREMEDRYKKMSKVGVRNVEGFNNRVEQARKKGETVTRTVQTGFDRETGEAIYETEELELEPMPFIIVVIDEMADLMMVAGKDIEGTVQRLAQMARAAGIHVIMATQRPSVDVITGTIKANFPTRISFQVTSKIDSRTILGEMGAEQLLGMGDMLYMAGGGRITRVHGPFVDDNEVEEVVKHLKLQGIPQYLEAVTEEDEEDEELTGGTYGDGGSDSDDPYDQAVAIVLSDRKASTSYIQRRLSIGYNRAATLIERMEQEGVISPANHAGKREILVPAEDETM